MADAYKVTASIRGLSREGKASLASLIARVKAAESKYADTGPRKVHRAYMEPLAAQLPEVTRLPTGDVQHAGTVDGNACSVTFYGLDTLARLRELGRAEKELLRRRRDYDDAMVPDYRIICGRTVRLRHGGECVTGAWAVDCKTPHACRRAMHARIADAEANVARLSDPALVVEADGEPDAGGGYTVIPSQIRALSTEGRAWFRAIAKNAAGGWRKSKAIAAATEAARAKNAGEFVSRSDTYADDLPPPLPRVKPKPKRAYVRRAKAVPVAPSMVASPSDVIDAQELTTPGTPPWLVTLQAELSGDTGAPESTGSTMPTSPGARSEAPTTSWELPSPSYSSSASWAASDARSRPFIMAELRTACSST